MLENDVDMRIIHSEVTLNVGVSSYGGIVKKDIICETVRSNGSNEGYLTMTKQLEWYKVK